MYLCVSSPLWDLFRPEGRNGPWQPFCDPQKSPDTPGNIEYNPLENYDRYEEYEGSGTSESDTSTSGSGSGSDTLTKAAANSSSYEPYDKHTTSESSSSSGGTDVEYGDEHTSHIHGNIGVTTSQQMLESELEIAKFNIYTTIADLFADEFCIMVY